MPIMGYVSVLIKEQYGLGRVSRAEVQSAVNKEYYQVDLGVGVSFRWFGGETHG